MRRIPFVDLKAGFVPIKDEVMRAIEDVFTGMDLNMGPNCRALEEEFAGFCGTRYAIGVGSGTEALQFSLLAAGVKSGDEVITSPHTFFATAEAIACVGANPVFVDIDTDTYGINPRGIEVKITSRTKAILPVHMYGQTAEMESIIAIAEKYGLPVIEDACQAHGALYKGARAGTMGDAGCFSFYFTKNLGAYGEAGIVITDDEKIADSVRLYRNHGHKSKFEHVVFGYNGRMDEIQAAILRIKLRYLDEYNQKRRERAAIYNSLLKDTPLLLPVEAENRRHVYHLYVVRCPVRDGLMEHLSNNGVGVGIHYKNPVHLQEALSGSGYRRADFPRTESACSEILSLPIYPELKEEDQIYIYDKIREYFNGQ